MLRATRKFSNNCIAKGNEIKIEETLMAEEGVGSQVVFVVDALSVITELMPGKKK